VMQVQTWIGVTIGTKLAYSLPKTICILASATIVLALD
jgi:hypothetical protein